MQLVREYIDFTKGKDPKKAMGIGKHYDIWRENHMNKPVMKILLLLKDHFGQEYTYSVDMMYGQEQNYRDASKVMDSIWFANESILKENRTYGELKYPFFPSEEEKTSWENPDVFNKDFIDPMEEDPEKTFDRLMSEWFETTWRKTAEHIATEFLKNTNIDTGVPEGGFILEDIQYQYFE